MTKIAIIDDEILIREWLQMSIEKVGAEFEITGLYKNGEEALNAFQIETPQIVITDIVMPKIDGLELTSELRKRYKGMKIIILTSHDDFEYARGAIKSGADDYFLKSELNSEKIGIILNEIAQRIALEHGDECNIDITPQHSKSIEQAIDYITNNFSRHISLKEIAGLVGFNEEYFSRLFKKECGINYSDFVINIRMEEAKLLLLSTSLNIGEIAEKIGIASSAYFSQLFRKYSGLSPSQFRENRTNE